MGGLILEKKKILSNSEKLTGSLPKKGAKEEYDEIGILKIVKDSMSPINISIKIKVESKLKTLSILIIEEENDMILRTIMIPQKI